ENFKVAIHPDFLDQEITIEGTISIKARTELCTLLKRNLNIFAWQPSDMTRVPRSITEHRLNIREGYPPVRQKNEGRPRSAPKQSKYSLDTSLFCESSAAGSRAKLYLNGKASPGASLRSQEVALILPGASHRGHHRPAHQTSDTMSRRGRAIAKIEHNAREHNITYRSRTSVKVQILANFLVEKSDDAPPEASMIETL
nr:reverse transcriptase domain-containing protein [Tanacetum cinerariifolium]